MGCNACVSIAVGEKCGTLQRTWSQARWDAIHVFLLQWGRSVVHCKEPDDRRDGIQCMCFYCSGEEVWYIAKNLITGEMGYNTCVSIAVGKKCGTLQRTWSQARWDAIHVFLLQWGRSVVHCKEPDHRRDGIQYMCFYCSGEEVWYCKEPDHRRDGMEYMCFYCSGEEVWYIAKNLITGEMGYNTCVSIAVGKKCGTLQRTWSQARWDTIHVFLLQWGRSVVHCKEPDHRRDGIQYMCFYCSGEEVWYIAKNLIIGEMGYNTCVSIAVGKKCGTLQRTWSQARWDAIHVFLLQWGRSVVHCKEPDHRRDGIHSKQLRRHRWQQSWDARVSRIQLSLISVSSFNMITILGIDHR